MTNKRSALMTFGLGIDAVLETSQMYTPMTMPCCEKSPSGSTFFI